MGAFSTISLKARMMEELDLTRLSIARERGDEDDVFFFSVPTASEPAHYLEHGLTTLLGVAYLDLMRTGRCLWSQLP